MARWTITVATAALFVLGIGGTGAATSPAPASVVRVHGTESCSVTRMGDNTDVPGAIGLRDHELVCTDTMNDPRVSGPWINVFNMDCYGGEGVDCVFWGTEELTTADGGWACTYAGSEDPTGDNWGQVFIVCPGTGGFAGLTYVTQHVFDAGTDGSFRRPPGSPTDRISYSGMIYQGPPPTMVPSGR